MKRIILTETQYKRLIKKRLNEQEVVFKDPKDKYDITNEMMQLLIHLKFYIDTMANKSLYIDTEFAPVAPTPKNPVTQLPISPDFICLRPIKLCGIN